MQELVALLRRLLAPPLIGRFWGVYVRSIVAWMDYPQLLLPLQEDVVGMVEMVEKQCQHHHCPHTVLQPYQPIFAALTFGLLAVAFYYLYIQPKRCRPGDLCASPAVLEKQRMMFRFVVAGIILIGVAYAAIPLME